MKALDKGLPLVTNETGTIGHGEWRFPPKPHYDPQPIENPCSLYSLPNEAVPGPLPFFPHVPAKFCLPLPLEPTDDPVPSQETISCNDMDRLSDGVKAFFKRMLSPNVKHV